MAVTERNVLTGERIQDAGDIDYSRGQTSKNRLRRVIGAAAAFGVGVLGVAGSHLMFRNNNMDDFTDLRKFTSPAHQTDRQNMQAAFDAQDEMRQHFDAQGGVTEDQAAVMAQFTGLTEEQVSSLVSTELYRMDFDGDVATASSQEATVGAIMVASAAGMTIGAVSHAALRRRK